MGTDITLVVQRRIASGWQTTELSLESSRNYFSFAVLSGIRNHYGCGEPIAYFGIPDDTVREVDCYPTYDYYVTMPSGERRFVGQGGVYYITLEELQAWVNGTADKSMDYLIQSWVTDLTAYASNHSIPPCDIRVIFGFV